VKSSTVLEPPAEPPKGFVDMGAMLEYFWPHEPSRPSAFKVTSACRDGGTPHLRWGARYYFDLREVREYFERLKIPQSTTNQRRKEG
jgi:hypothetical protein